MLFPHDLPSAIAFAHATPLPLMPHLTTQGPTMCHLITQDPTLCGMTRLTTQGPTLCGMPHLTTQGPTLCVHVLVPPPRLTSLTPPSPSTPPASSRFNTATGSDAGVGGQGRGL